MFGKKQKTKNKKQKKDELVMHIMQDDLDINSDKLIGSRSKNSEDSRKRKGNGPFTTIGHTPSDTQKHFKTKKELQVKEEKEGEKKSDESLVSKLNLAHKKESPIVKTKKSSISSNEQTKKTKISVNNIPPKLKVNSAHDTKEKPSFENITENIDSDHGSNLNFKLAPEKKLKDDSFSAMPKSVSHLTTNVEKSDKVFKNTPKKATNKKIQSKKKNKREKTGAFSYVFTTISIVLIGVIGYIIWNSDYKIDIGLIVPKEEEPVVDLIEIPEKPVEVDQGREFSEKVNFLTVTNLSSQEIMSLFNEIFLEMNDYDGNLLEFVIVDENNKPIKFVDFVSVLGIILPVDVMSQLSDDFSVYLYKNGVAEKVGIAIKIVDRSMLEIEVTKGESDLAKGMEALFLENIAIEDELSKKIFNSSTYNGLNVRYVNLDERNSVDYVFIDNYFLIATSKDSGRAIMNKMLLESEGAAKDLENNSKGAEDVDSEVFTKDIFNESNLDDELGSGETIIETQ